MKIAQLVAQPLTAQAFAAFGDVIGKDPANRITMNAARFDRYPALASIDIGSATTNLSIISCRVVSELPYEITLLERHPHGSQAFVPLSRLPFVVVVAPAGHAVKPDELRAFISDGEQGVNMRRGVWHIPLIGFEVGQEFIVIDSSVDDNCDEHHLSEPVLLNGAIT